MQNQLLAALPATDQQRLMPLLEWVELPAAALLQEAGKKTIHVYFPAHGSVSLVSTMQDGASAEVAVVGREGLVGVCAFLGNHPALNSALVQSPGHAHRLAASALRELALSSPSLMQALLGYTQVLLTQMAQTSACSRHHAIDQQLCRFLLMQLDRLSGDQIALTQERISHMLGVRREGVTAGALKLQHAGLIRYARGRIRVLDRAGIEARCCECYAAMRCAFDRLTPDRANPSVGVVAHGCGDSLTAVSRPGAHSNTRAKDALSLPATGPASHRVRSRLLEAV